MKTNEMYVRFHIGRGGRFHNQGHLSYVNEDNFQELLAACGDKLGRIEDTYNPETEEETPLPEDKWAYINEQGRVMVEGREAMEAMTGTLDWDGEYDTDHVTTVEELSDREIETLWEAYRNHAYMSADLMDAICTLKDKKRVHHIKRDKNCMECFIQTGTVRFDYERDGGTATRGEWEARLKYDMDFCPHSVDKILDEMESWYTNTDDFLLQEK